MLRLIGESVKVELRRLFRLNLRIVFAFVWGGYFRSLANPWIETRYYD